MSWYEKSYRRHLCDMHINDYDESFLSEFSPEKYLECLKAAEIDAPMLYFQSHTGLCYYPTKVGRIHNAFRNKPDMMKQLVDLCHKEGMSVIGYYSLNFNNYAHDLHPEWRMVKYNGKSSRSSEPYRYGLCCPNNMEYRQFVFAQIKEMLDYFDVEGMFYDMPYWDHICYCENCRRRFKEETGYELPQNRSTSIYIVDDDLVMLVNKKQMEWMGEWTKAVKDYTRSLRPNVSIEQNFASAIIKYQWRGCGDEVNDQCDYTGGDLYGGFLEQSFTSKFYYNETKNQPFEYMTGRCNPNLEKHTITKSHDQLKLAVMLTCAHHGANLLIDAIDPVGTMDKRVYDLFGNIMRDEMPYEKYLTGKLYDEVGVYYGLTSKFNRFNSETTHFDGALGATKKLIETHIPVGVVTSYQMGELDRYQAIICSLTNNVPEATGKAIADYVRNGGNLYLSGGCDNALMQLLGLRLDGFTEHCQTYVGPLDEYIDELCSFDRKYPVPFEMPLPLVSSTDSMKDAKVLATIVLPYSVRGKDNDNFASIHSDPPGIITNYPAIIEKKVGKGKIIWSAAPFEASMPLPYKKIFTALLKRLGMKSTISSSAPRNAELITFKDNNITRISTVYLTEEDESPVVPGFEIKIQTGTKPEYVHLLPDGQDIGFTFDNGITTFKTRDLHIFDMYEIKQ